MHTPHSAHISGSLPDPRPSHHSHAVVAGNTIYISGAIARQMPSGLHEGVARAGDGSLVHDVAVQFRSAMGAVLSVLDELGAELHCIAEVCVYLCDVSRDFSSFNSAYGEMFVDWKPARTTVGVAALPSNVAIELKVTAVLA